MRKYILILALGVLSTSTAVAVCSQIKADKSSSALRKNRVECLRQSKFMLNAPHLAFTESKEFRDALAQPTSKKGDLLINGSVVYCRFVPVEQNGTSTKFRCAQTDAANQLMDSKGQIVAEAKSLIAYKDDFLLADSNGVVMTETGANIQAKTRKAQILKVRYHDGSPRNVENYTSTAASRILWAMGIPTHTNIMTEKVICFGCNKSPFNSQKDAVIENQQYILNEFADASIEIKFSGKRLYSPIQEPWNWQELNVMHEHSSPATKLEIEVLALAAHFVGAVGTSKGQNAIVCQKFKKGTDECESVVAMIHDIGATFGNRIKSNPFQFSALPRGDILGFEKARIFSKATCQFQNSDDGKQLPLNISQAAQDEFMRRALILNKENLRLIFSASHMGRLMNVPAKTSETELIERWVNAVENKLQEIKSAPCR